MLARIRNAFHHFLRDRRLKLSGRQIIHKKQRRRTLNSNVVHAVVHQVSAHRGMQPHFESNLQLRPDAIHARHQHRIDILGLVHREEAAEPANFTQHAAGKGLMRQILDALLSPVRAVNIDPSVGVGDGSSCGCGVLGHGLSRCPFLSASVWENAGFLAKQQFLRPLIVARSWSDARRAEAQFERDSCGDGRPLDKLRVNADLPSEQ